MKVIVGIQSSEQRELFGTILGIWNYRYIPPSTFSKYSTLESLLLKVDKNGSTGYGNVRFEHGDSWNRGRSFF